MTWKAKLSNIAIVLIMAGILPVSAGMPAQARAVSSQPAQTVYSFPVKMVAFPAKAAKTWQSHYRVISGDTLSALAARFYGDDGLWPALWWVNKAHVRNPDLIYIGQRLYLSRWHPGDAWILRAANGARPGQVHYTARVTVSRGDNDGDNDNAVRHSAPQAAAPRGNVSGGFLSYTGLENLWVAAGGARWAAATAACIAEHESGGNQYATGPVGERGYWQINPVNGSLSTYNAYRNARAAIILSHDGTNWSAWTTAPMCGV